MTKSVKQSKKISRREFVRDSATLAAAVATGLSLAGAYSVEAAEKDQAAVRKTRSYHPDMEYRRLGKTGLWVSAVCMGGHWKRIDKIIGASAELNPYVAPTDPSVLNPFENNRKEVVAYCLSKGINLIDLAGDSEAEVYAKAVRERREEVYLAYSHPSSELREPPNRNAKKLLELFDAGLKRCRLDYVDIFYSHRFDPNTPLEETMGALDYIVRSGRALYVGISTYSPEETRRAAQMLRELGTPCLIHQPRYNMFDRWIEDGLLDALAEEGMGSIVFSPLAQGILTNKYIEGIPPNRAAPSTRASSTGAMPSPRCGWLK